MDLTPELLLEAKFAPARRGYDMNEVDDFLERCAEGLDVLLARLKAEFDRAERAEETVAELRKALDRGTSGSGGPVPAPAQQPEPSEPTRPEPEPAPEPVAEAPVPPEHPVHEPADQPIDEPSVGEPMRILIAAERTAEAAIADARADAERIRAEAESVASTTRSEAEALLARSRAEAEAEARRAGEEARRTIESEVLSLRRDRDALTHDVRALRRWLDEQRSRLRTTARDLQRLVEDPAALRELPVPELREDATEQIGDDDAEAVQDAPEATDDGDLTIFDDDGEPTQSVPTVDGLRVFDDEEDEHDPASAGPQANGSDALR